MPYVSNISDHIDSVSDSDSHTHSHGHSNGNGIRVSDVNCKVITTVMVAVVVLASVIGVLMVIVMVIIRLIVIRFGRVRIYGQKQAKSRILARNRGSIDSRVRL